MPASATRSLDSLVAQGSQAKLLMMVTNPLSRAFEIMLDFLLFAEDPRSLGLDRRLRWIVRGPIVDGLCARCQQPTDFRALLRREEAHAGLVCIKLASA